MNARTEICPAVGGLHELDELTLHHQVSQFLYHEARLQDVHDYESWESLWEDDAIYWIPANGDDIDPEQKMSVIYDNRSRIHIRVEQLLTGRRHTQTPRSALTRLISNIEIVEIDNQEVTALANVLIYEDNLRGETHWATRNEYRLRLVNSVFRLVRKKIVLVNGAKPIFTLSFLI